MGDTFCGIKMEDTFCPASDIYKEIHLLHLTTTKFMDLKGTQLLLLFFAFLCSQVRKLNGDLIPGCMLSERNALLGFKEGLKDPANRLSSWVGEDCCRWEAVACDNRTGHVIKLDLQNPHQFSVTGDLLLYNKWSLGGELRPSLLGLKHLNYLDLSMNNFGGLRIPEFVGSFRQLKYLNLSNAGLGGLIPHQLGNLSSLQYLDLYNGFDLSIDNALWISHLSSLRYLNMTGVEYGDGAHWLQALNMLPSIVEFLEGKIPVALGGLCKLKHLGLSGINISKNLHELDEVFSGCIKNGLQTLYMWDTQLSGYLPDCLGDFRKLKSLHLGSNSISGPIPASIGRLSALQDLDLWNNKLNGTIPENLGRLTKLVSLDLSSNFLEGVMSEERNSLSGSIPPSICLLPYLESLHLSNNNRSGGLPLSLKGCRSLVTLDLGQNGFSGVIPTWIGESLLSLKILRLRSNKLVGNIPPNLSTLSAPQILDLANNNLSEIIPSGFGNFTAMKVLRKTYGPILSYYKHYENLQVTIKGTDIEYAIFLSLVIAMDLSDNNLSGKIPEELTNLFGLVSLNLSGNHLTGEIPEKIGALRQLESLDLSRNNLFGGIPSSMIFLTFLSYLNLSYNNFSGRVPTGNQLQTFTDPSIYAGNPSLCGFPLTQKCKDAETNEVPNAPEGDEQNDNAMNEDGSEMKWLYMSMGLRYAIGLWAIFGPLLFNRKWREAYFQLIDYVYDMVYAALAVIFTRFKEHIIAA
ncbi:receptor-like protein EIX2 [Phoenix dactylifera]|uniref:Receptor-like protein EIX2 n=1 Tax=Phoenix dactylifera TaxID=42345 RepID=A0A8B8ZL43_PHODC|nr:receptor-like protein EIX2 [Phoenix dactylifera]